MKPKAIRDPARREARAALGGAGLRFACGPFVAELRAPLVSIADDFAARYADVPLSEAAIVDYPFAFRRAPGRFGFVTKQITLHRPGAAPLGPVDPARAVSLLGSALVQAIDASAHDFAVTRAAVLERHGFALVLPGPCGNAAALAAALAPRGWRLLSLARALLRLADGALLPLPLPDETLAPALLRQALQRGADPARARWIVFLGRGDGGAALEPLPKARALFGLVEATANQAAIGTAGFDRLAQAVDGAGCYALRATMVDQAAIDDAAAALDALGRSPAAQVA